MIFSWLKNERRKNLLAKPLSTAWRGYLHENVRHYRYLTSQQRTMIERVVRIFVAEKNWVGGAGFDVTDEMRVAVAGQAAVMGLGQDEPYYFDHVQSVILYPGRYVHPAKWRQYGWSIAGGGVLSGEAWHRGPIVLSWLDVLAAGRDDNGGQNLVIHEFAHHLDDLDGEADGTPCLASGEHERAWYQVTEAEYLRLLGQAQRSEVTLLDHYGASNRAEFFAVASECFFERPHAMLREHEELYGVLRDFYRLDPAQWLPDAKPMEERDEPEWSRRMAAKAARFRKARLAVLRGHSADDLFMLASDYLDEGRYRLAAAAATRAIRLDPRDPEAYQQRAFARVKLGRYQAALADCDSALRLDGDDGTTYRVRGAACIGLGLYVLAKQDVDRVLKENRDDAEALYLRGRVWMALGKPREAVADLTRSLAIRPLVAEVYYHSGLAHRAQGDDEAAEADLAKAFQLDPLVDRRP